MSANGSDPISAMGAVVQSHARFIVDAARAAPPGGGLAWDRVLESYGLRGDPPAARLEQVRALGMTAGATPVEVRKALEAMVTRATGELSRLAPGDPRAHALSQWAASLARDEVARYEAAARPRAVAGLFANAAEGSAESPWALRAGVSAVVLACPACGAPQERASDFLCRYCRASMAGGGAP